MIFSISELLNIDTKSLYLFGTCLGAGLAMGLGAIGAAIGMGFAGGKACQAISRQPEAAPDITKTMLVGQAISETTAIFALVIAILLVFVRPVSDGSAIGFLGLIGAGLSIGLGALGSGVGGGLPNMEACEGVGKQPKNAPALLKLMIVGQALSQSSVVFALLVSFFILFNVDYSSIGLVGAIACLSGGLCMGAGSIGPGYGLGIAAQGAVSGLAVAPKEFTVIFRTMLMGQAVAQSTAIYSLVIALLLVVQFT